MASHLAKQTIRNLAHLDKSYSALQTTNAISIPHGKPDQVPRSCLPKYQTLLFHLCCSQNVFNCLCPSTYSCYNLTWEKS
jgi:hypothetical protein